MLRVMIPGLVVAILSGCKEESPRVSSAAAAPMVPAAAVQPVPKFATVDVQRLFKEYHLTRKAQKEINIERAKIQEENNDRLARIRGIEADLENLERQLGDRTLPESRRHVVSNDIAVKRQEGIALDRERREFLQRRNQALREKSERQMKGILDEIRGRVAENAQAGDFDYVFDKSAESSSQVPFFLATPEGNDLTDSLLEELNAGLSPTGETEAGKGGGDDVRKPD